MLRKSVTKLHRNQSGFTLLEILVSLAIVAITIPAIGGSVFLLMNVNAQRASQLKVLTQAERAVHWIKRDAQMAQIVEPSGGSGFPLDLSWVDWDNTRYQVSYTLENDKLFRSYSVNGGEPSRAIVAELINTDTDKTNCQFAVGVLAFKVTVSTGGFKPASETRTAQVMPRPAP